MYQYFNRRALYYEFIVSFISSLCKSTDIFYILCIFHDEVCPYLSTKYLVFQYVALWSCAMSMSLKSRWRDPKEAVWNDGGESSQHFGSTLASCSLSDHFKGILACVMSKRESGQDIGGLCKMQTPVLRWHRIIDWGYLCLLSWVLSHEILLRKPSIFLWRFQCRGRLDPQIQGWA